MIGRIVEVAENGHHLSSCSENAVNPQPPPPSSGQGDETSCSENAVNPQHSLEPVGD